MFITRTVAFSTSRHFFSQPEVQRTAGGRAETWADHDVLHCWGFHPGAEDKSTSYDRSAVVTVVSAVTQRTFILGTDEVIFPPVPCLQTPWIMQGNVTYWSADRRHRQENVHGPVLTCFSLEAERSADVGWWGFLNAGKSGCLGSWIWPWMLYEQRFCPRWWIKGLLGSLYFLL